MAHLLYTATGRDGEPAKGFVEADTAEQAHQSLLSQGFTDVVLHQEVMVPQDSGELAALSAHQQKELARLKLELLRKPGLLTVMGGVWRGNRFWLAIDVLMIGWGIWTRDMYWFAFGAVFAALPFVMAAWSYRHSGRYTQLLRSFALGDWARVRDLAQKLRSIGKTVKLLDFDLDIRLAGIKARQGKLEEALRDLEGWRLHEYCMSKPGLFEARVAAVYGNGEDRVGFIRLMEEAWKLSSNDPSRALDLALALARFGDVARAEKLLAGIDAALLPPHAAGFQHWARGVIELRSAQPAALASLDMAVAAFLKLFDQPAAWTALAFCTCDHAIALNLAGKREQAQRELADVWPVLRVHADKPLIRSLQADGLLPA